MRFCPVVKSMFQRYQVSWKQFFRKYLASNEQIIRILSACKCDFCQLDKPMFQGISQRVGIFLSFSLFSSFFREEKSTFQAGMASLGFTLLGLTWLSWLGFAWLGFSWFHFAWLALALLGLASLGLAWLGLTWLGFTGMGWLGLAWICLA